MTAKEMFEKLGYEQVIYNGGVVGFGYDKKTKPIKTINIYTDDMSFFSTSRITMKEYQAITQQMKELGWIE